MTETLTERLVELRTQLAAMPHVSCTCARGGHCPGCVYLRALTELDDLEDAVKDARIKELEEALRESCEDWDKMRMAGIQAAGPRLNKRMEERIARWKGLCEKDE